MQSSLCVVAGATLEGASDDVLVWGGFGDDGLLEESVEEHATLLRCATVEAECELVEVGIEVY